MIINGVDLFFQAPIVGMLDHKAKSHGVSHGLSEAGYDIRIKQEVFFLPEQGLLCIGGEYKRGNFALASAIERFDMPQSLVGIVHDKSTWARHGLSVFNTVIEPGWKGFLTLELVYHGSEELFIPEGAGIAQVVFHQASQRAAYHGKYQNQEDMPVAARES